MSNAAISRRSFLVASAASGGFMLGFHLPAAHGRGDLTAPAEINAWIVINPDNTTIIRVARAELGQGIATALPRLIAEELGCDWAHVTSEFVNPHKNTRPGRPYGSMATEGSRAVRDTQENLRRAGATARHMLIAAAASRWNVAPEDCVAAQSKITHRPSGRAVDYATVATLATRMAPPANVELREPSEWTLIGRDVTPLDIERKVLAQPIYALDLRLPGMLYAAVAHCPAFGGTLRSVDSTAIDANPGINAVIQFDNSVAVVAENTWLALQGIEKLRIEWDRGPHSHIQTADIARHLKQGLAAADAVVCRNDGDTPTALTAAVKVIEADYFVPFLSHAPMETMNCTAREQNGILEIWAPTQDVEESLRTAARAAGLDPGNVVVHPVHSGGGFGRRGGNLDFITEAVVIARKLGRPVQLIWSRKEDIQHDFYRPVSSARLTAGFDAAGTPIAWSTRISGQSILSTDDPAALAKGPDLRFLVGFTDNPYSVPNMRVDYAMRNTHVPVGYWRSVNHSQNGFFRECFVDEMAAAAGADPYLFRRALLVNAPKHRQVLDAAAKHANWGAPLPQGVFRGIAQVDAYGSFVASVLEVSMARDGKPEVRRVVTAVDCGYVVHPDGLRAQVEGAVAWALSAALYGEITIGNGGVEQANFDTYRMLQLREMPEIEVVLAPTGGFWGGGGEVGVPTIAPALANAMFAATGKRTRRQPIVKNS